MAVDIGPVLSLVSQRIILAPSSVSDVTPAGKTTPQKRYREGMINEGQFRQEMTSLGYSGPAIDQALIQSTLERQYDLYTDKLAALQVGYDKDLINYDQLRVQVLEVVPDQPKALQLLELWDFRKRPAPKTVTPDKIPTLTVTQLLSAWKAGVLLEAELTAELLERNYSGEDAAILIATEIAKMEKPTAAKQKALTLTELKAALSWAMITPAEFLAELVSRGYSQEDAELIVGIEVNKILARSA